MHPIELEAVGPRREMCLERDSMEVRNEMLKMEIADRKKEVKRLIRDIGRRITESNMTLADAEARLLAAQQELWDAEDERKNLENPLHNMRMKIARCGRDRDDVDYFPRDYVPRKKVHTLLGLDGRLDKVNSLGERGESGH